MAQKAYHGFSTKTTPQSRPIPGSTQIPNAAGGHAWPIDIWQRLERFLILGSEGGTYYVGEQEFTAQNAMGVMACLQADGPRAVKSIVDLSIGWRAAKNDPAIFALAMAMGIGDLKTKQAAEGALPLVCRIPTHLFHFLEYSKQFRGWGRLFKRAVANCYEQMDAKKLALHVVKYQQRDGWSQKDAIILSHPYKHPEIYNYVVGERRDADPITIDKEPVAPFEIIYAFEQAKLATGAEAIVKLILDYDLPRECIPNQWLNNAEIWSALLIKMPAQAMVRNLGKMTSVGLIAPMAMATTTVCQRLRDPKLMRRMHPVEILSALLTYKQGKGMKGHLTWEPVTSVIDALDDAFYASFDNVEPTGKRVMVAIDVSGSMHNQQVNGLPYLSCHQGAGAMAMAFMGEADAPVSLAFDTQAHLLSLSKKMRLDDVVWTVQNAGRGGTDCSVPIQFAEQRKIPIDAFVILTDNETWAGRQHPIQTLEHYRQKMGIDAKMISIAMTATEYSIGKPNDQNTLNAIGFDTAVPALTSNFIRGQIGAQATVDEELN